LGICRLPDLVTAQGRPGETWHHRLNQLTRDSSTPTQWTIVRLDLRATFWNLLAYEHDGLTERVEAYRHECARCADTLRQHFDPHPALGPQAADACIAEEIDAARREFAHDLEREKEGKEPTQESETARAPLPAFLRSPYEWRSKRGQRRGSR